MVERILQQLDKLERGARIDTRPTQDEYNDSSAEYSAYDGYDRSHEAYYAEEAADQPMALDSFGEGSGFLPTGQVLTASR